MNTCPMIPGPPKTASVLTAATVAVALTLIFFWGLSQSSDHLQPRRGTPAAVQGL